MTGLLSSYGIRVSGKRVGKSLCQVNPTLCNYQHSCITTTARKMNPYLAEYFGHKLHIDQNEKLFMFGVTHICAVDGCSGKIVGLIKLPIKNNVEIYGHLFRLVEVHFI